MIARAAIASLALACAEPHVDPPRPESATVLATADAAHGRELLARFECNRCHDGTGLDDPPIERACVHCHQEIHAGTFDAPAANRQRWSRNLHSLDHTPDLTRLGLRLRQQWVVQFLVSPFDVRPGLEASMPRFRMTPSEATDIAAALTAGAEVASNAPDGRSAAGLELMNDRGCFGCHAFSGLRLAATTTQPLAPDLRYTRDRMTRAMIGRWLRAPSEVLPGTPMPTPTLTDDERAHVTEAILTAPLAPVTLASVPARLPLLDREVRFAEVQERVLSRTCWHCHSDPDFARGDGGAGNTGGFGFPGRGVNLFDYPGVSSGYLAEDGERRSLFALDDGVPHLVRVLMARHSEVAGTPVTGLTGMPLGLPPVSVGDIQLVESWIAQGRPN